MPLLVTCDACGKQLKVRDELAGKRLKCPQCQNVFAASALGGSKQMPLKVRPQPEAQKQVAFEIPWSLMLKLSPVVIIVAVVLMVYYGPVRVWDQFEVSAKGIENETTDVLVRGLMSNMQESGLYDPVRSHYRPEVHVQLFRPVLAMSMPEYINFRGAIGTGIFAGKFNTKTREVSVTVEFPGRNKWGRIDASLPAERPPVQLAGRTREGIVTVDVNGRPAMLKAPKADNAAEEPGAAGDPPPRPKK